MTMASFMQELKKDWKVPPNLLTEARLIFSLAPSLLIIGLVIPNSPYRLAVAAVVFAIVAATDLLDGWWARKFNMVTRLGTILDPVVDKFLVGFTLIALSIMDPCVIFPTVIILIREIYVAIMQAHARKLNHDVSVITSGKIKMVAQCVAIALLILPTFYDWQMQITWLIVGVAVNLTITSGLDYRRVFAEAKKSK
jgi:CDP-diacylglycerol--glycerol-3-phosphate 3-phosphatidyltransferase